MIETRKEFNQFTLLLTFIFFLSGFASLIYQVVWQRMLTLHYGVGAISITIIVSVYMFGLGIGGLLGGFLSERFTNRITMYFVVELLIGLFGLASLPFINFLGRYTAGANYLLSFFYIFLFLSPPTLLMGITLPLVTKLFNHFIRDFLNTVSFLYFINTIGAAFGAFFASYFLISFFGLDVALFTAVAINFTLSVFIFLAKYVLKSSQANGRTLIHKDISEAMPPKKAYFLVFVTGFLAIGYEIVWFRVIGVLVKASPYAFSTVLSVYLFGIAIGSFLMHKSAKRRLNMGQKSLFFSLQFLIGLYVIFSFTAYYFLTKYTGLEILSRHSFIHDLHPHLAIPSFQSLGSLLRGLFSILDVVFWPAVFVLIPTALMGASFPLISSLALVQEDKEGLTVGTVYFFNIAGNVIGGLCTGFLILPHLGTENTLILFSSTGLFLGMFVVKLGKTLLSFGPKITVCVVLFTLNLLLFPRSGELYQMMHSSPGRQFKTYIEEGIDGVILTYNDHDNFRNYINGLHHGGRPGYEYYNKVIEAVGYAPKVENVLIIGFGTGSFTEAILRLPELKEVTVVEISKALITNLRKFPLFTKMLADTRLKLVLDDARRFLFRTTEKYDMILMDPLRTTTSYSNNLYSRYFFRLVSKHLTNEGVILIYADEMHVLPKTVSSVFAQVRLYRHKTNCFSIASQAPLVYRPEKKSDFLRRFSIRERIAILRTNPQLVGDQDYIKKVSRNYPINQDLRPVCEYYIGLRVKQKLFQQRLEKETDL